MGYDGRDPRFYYRPEYRDPAWYPHPHVYPDWPPPPLPPEPPKRAPRRTGRRLLRFFLAVTIRVACVAAVLIGGLFVYYTFAYPDPLAMRPQGTGPVVRIMARDGTPLAERGVSRDYIPLDMLPPHAADAVVAIEDRRFFDHPGIDPAGLIRAAVINARAGRVVQGGSTITQQLVKNLFLSSERTFERKAEEILMAIWLELRLTKREILELYLNRVYFGGGAHGIEAASQRYFGKSARHLTLPEAAVIAGLLKAPSRYAPSASPVQAVARGRVVVEKMREAGFIGDDEAATALAADIQFSPLMRVPGQPEMAYAVDLVLDAASRFENADNNEIIIETTLDATLQRQAAGAIERKLAERGEALDASQAAIVVVGPDGGIRALVGGRSYADSQFNRATRAHRQPGSAFKPVVYLTAIEQGLTPDSIVEDAPVTAGRWSPRNENGRHIGPTTLRNALAQSINTVAVRLLLATGVDAVMATARRLGMTAPLRRDASLALGTSEVSLLDLTGAYAAFANGGYVNAPYAVRQVRTGAGKVLFQRIGAQSGAAISPAAIAAMDDLLGAVVSDGTGRRAAIPGHRVAGKTGTSQEYRDAWFIGYTQELTAGVWVGNDDGRAMKKVVGGTLPAEIWREVMTVAMERTIADPALSGAVGEVRSATEALDEARSRTQGQGKEAPLSSQPSSDQMRGETSVTPDGRILVMPPSQSQVP